MVLVSDWLLTKSSKKKTDFRMGFIQIQMRFGFHEEYQKCKNSSLNHDLNHFSLPRVF